MLLYEVFWYEWVKKVTNITYPYNVSKVRLEYKHK